MGFMDKIHEFVNPVDEDDEEVYEDDEVEAADVEAVEDDEDTTENRYERPKTRANANALNANTKMVLFDFLTGVVFALDGKIQKIGQNVILCSPAQIGVAGSITIDSDDSDEE